MPTPLENPEYVALREHVKGKTISQAVLGLFGLALLAVAGAAIYAIVAPAAVPILGGLGSVVNGVLAATVGIAGVGVAYKSVVQGIELEMDEKELASRRQAANLSAVLGQGIDPRRAVMASYAMGQEGQASGRSDGRPWTDIVSQTTGQTLTR